MRQAGTAGGVWLWAARLLVVCALAVCAAAIHAPMHSPDAMPTVSGPALSHAGFGGGARAAVAPAVDAQAGAGNQAASAGVLEVRADAPDQGAGCGCCPHGAATCCIATTEDPSPHECLCPRRSAEYGPAAVAPAGIDFRVNPATPPSLSELSLLRI